MIHQIILCLILTLTPPAHRTNQISDKAEQSSIPSHFVNDPGPAWLTNLDSAEKLASREHRKILLNFSGSDWCIPCISLHKEIFDTETFIRFSEDYIILVNADFPRKKKNQLSPEQQKINDQLAEKYNPDGHFPLTILLDEEGNPIKIWEGFYKKGPDNFIQEIKDAAGIE